MADKQKFWVRNALGEYALLEGAAERDRLSAFGWTETAVEPAPEAFIWLRFEGVEMPAKFPAQSVPHWMAAGWAPGAPPEHVDVTKEPDSGPLSLAAMAAEPAKPAAVGKNAKE